MKRKKEKDFIISTDGQNTETFLTGENFTAQSSAASLFQKASPQTPPASGMLW